MFYRPGQLRPARMRGSNARQHGAAPQRARRRPQERANKLEMQKANEIAQSKMQGPAMEEEPNPGLEMRAAYPAAVRALLEPFAEDPPELEVYDRAAGEAATARVEAKAAAMRAALAWGVDALADLNADWSFVHERLIAEGANQDQMEHSLHLSHSLYRDVLHAIVKARNEWHTHNRGHFFPHAEGSSPEDEALIAAEFLLKHESDTESAPSSVATQIFNPDTSSDEDMP